MLKNTIKSKVANQKKGENYDKKDMLNEDMYQANKYSNIMMPIANNLGNLQYVSIAIIGTILALSGNLALSIGTIVSFLQLTRIIERGNHEDLIAQKGEYYQLYTGAFELE